MSAVKGSAVSSMTGIIAFLSGADVDILDLSERVKKQKYPQRVKSVF